MVVCNIVDKSKILSHQPQLIFRFLLRWSFNLLWAKYVFWSNECTWMDIIFNASSINFYLFLMHFFSFTCSPFSMFFIVYSSNLCHIPIKMKPFAQSLHVLLYSWDWKKYQIKAVFCCRSWHLNVFKLAKINGPLVICLTFNLLKWLFNNPKLTFLTC